MRGNVEVSGVPLPTNQPISGINNFLQYLLATSNIEYTGRIYVTDGLDMTMTMAVFLAGLLPTFGENTKPAIRRASRLGFYAEGIRAKIFGGAFEQGCHRSVSRPAGEDRRVNNRERAS